MGGITGQKNVFMTVCEGVSYLSMHGPAVDREYLDLLLIGGGAGRGETQSLP